MTSQRIWANSCYLSKQKLCVWTCWRTAGGGWLKKPPSSIHEAMMLVMWQHPLGTHPLHMRSVLSTVLGIRLAVELPWSAVLEDLRMWNLWHWPNIRVSQSIVLDHTELPGILIENEVSWASDLPQSESLREAPRNVHFFFWMYIFLTSLPNDFRHHEVWEPLLQLLKVSITLGCEWSEKLTFYV